MGTIDRAAELEAAKRFAHAKRLQSKTSEQAEALMLDRRRSFLAPADRSFLESIIEQSDLMPLRYFALGQRAAAAVGRIFLQAPDGSGSGFATGFLVAPGLVLTNWHVLRTAEWAQGATLTMDAEDDIRGVPKSPRVFSLDPNRLFLSDQALDFAFCAVAIRAVDGTPLSRYGHLRLFGASGKIVRSEYATIIQHPNGRQKHIASRNNRIAVYPYDDDLTTKEKAANNFLYYSTDTVRGSSGSPVFSDQWYVVALHRRGVPETKTIKGKKVVLRTNKQPAATDDPDEVISYISNEGVRISRILARVDELSQNAKPPELRSDAARVRDAVADAAGLPSDGPFSRASSPVVVMEDPDQTVRRGGGGEVVARAAERRPMRGPQAAAAGHRPPDPPPLALLQEPSYCLL